MLTSRPARAVVALAVVGATVLALAPSASAARPPKVPWEGPAIRVKPGRLVVTFESGTSLAQRSSIHGAVGSRVTDRGRTTAIDVVELPRGLSPLAALRRYQADPRVVAAELDRIAAPTDIADDEFFHWQWALHNHHQPHPMTETGDSPQELTNGSSGADVDAPFAWANTTLGDDVTVAVLDTGVDVDHPDLAGSMWVNTLEQSGLPNVDDDDNGYVDDVNGWDFVATIRTPRPEPPSWDRTAPTSPASLRRSATTRSASRGSAGAAASWPCASTSRSGRRSRPSSTRPRTEPTSST